MRLALLGMVVLAAGPLCAQQPPDINFTIGLPKTAFYVGEAIPLQLSFSSTVAGKYTSSTAIADRSYRIDWAEQFFADADQFTEDPLADFPHFSIGGLDSDLPLSGAPFTFEPILNEWIRFRRPGTYRVHVVSRRVHGLVLSSNEVTLEIRAAPEGWAAQQFAAAIEVLDQPYSRGPRDFDPRNRAAAMLRFLYTPESVAELRKRFERAQPNPLNLPPEIKMLYVGGLGY